MAHGRRGNATINIDPDEANERLNRFLELLDADAASSKPALSVEPPSESGDAAPNVSHASNE